MLSSLAYLDLTTMSEDDDIHERIVEGEPYEQAELTVRRVIPLSLDRKIALAVLGLCSAALLAPALYHRRETIRALEGTESLAETLSPALCVLVTIGLVTTFGAGAVLVRQSAVAQRRALTPEQARRLVRIEDMLMLFVLQGLLFIVVPTTLAVAGAVSTGAVSSFYDQGVVIYQTDGPVDVDARLVSTLGVSLAAVLAFLWRRAKRGHA